MSEVTTFHNGDTVYFKDLENIPCKGHIRWIDVTRGIVSMSVAVDAAAEERGPETMHEPVFLFGGECFHTLEDLVNHEQEHHKYMIEYWESVLKEHKI